MASGPGSEPDGLLPDGPRGRQNHDRAGHGRQHHQSQLQIGPRREQEQHRLQRHQGRRAAHGPRLGPGAGRARYSRQLHRSRQCLRRLQDLESGVHQGLCEEEPHQARRGHPLLREQDRACGGRSRDRMSRTPWSFCARTGPAPSRDKPWSPTAGRSWSDKCNRRSVTCGRNAGRSECWDRGAAR